MSPDRKPFRGSEDQPPAPPSAPPAEPAVTREQLTNEIAVTEEKLAALKARRETIPLYTLPKMLYKQNDTRIVATADEETAARGEGWSDK